jgi:hypothetical protein
MRDPVGAGYYVAEALKPNGSLLLAEPAGGKKYLSGMII